MSRHVFQTKDWACELKSTRCAYTKQDGERCWNQVVIGGPLCAQHNRMVYGLRIAKSTIPGAGEGVFATRPIRAGATICPYFGETISKACFIKRYKRQPVAPYSLHRIDSACDRSLGSMANALFKANGKCRSESAHNATFVASHGAKTMVLVATKDIREGEEIFVYYGDQYILADVGTTRRSDTIRDTRPC